MHLFSLNIIGGYWAADKPYSWIKDQLEKPDPDPETKLVFCKEITAGISGMHEYIPKGFHHTFLIRHPYKVLDSWKRMLNRGAEDASKHMKLTEMPEFLFPSGFFYKDEYEVYQHVKKHYDPNPVIIDTDDLLANPSGILKAYCQAVGIPYSDDLLQWKPGRECLDQQWMVAKEQIMAQNLGNTHAESFSSICFGKPTGVPDHDSLSDDVRHYSDLSMKCYEEMYSTRLVV